MLSRIRGLRFYWGGKEAGLHSGERQSFMNAKPLPCGRSSIEEPGYLQTEVAFAMLGTMPLAILAIEAVIGFILVLVSVLFFATIFFAFVGFILLYIALWIALLLNGSGV